MYHDVVLLALAILLGGLIVWKHRGNLKRILNGTESKFSLHHKKMRGAESMKDRSDGQRRLGDSLAWFCWRTDMRSPVVL